MAAVSTVNALVRAIIGDIFVESRHCAASLSKGGSPVSVNYVQVLIFVVPPNFVLHTFRIVN